MIIKRYACSDAADDGDGNGDGVDGDAALHKPRGARRRVRLKVFGERGARHYYRVASHTHHA